MEASAKTHSSLRLEDFKEVRKYCQGICSFSRSANEVFHDLHLASFSVGKSASQSQLSVHNYLIRALPCIVIGAANPRGSYRLLTVERTPLLVNGFCFVKTRKVKLSPCKSQLSPNLHCKGRGSAPRSRSFRSVARSSAGKGSITVELLEAIF